MFIYSYIVLWIIISFLTFSTIIVIRRITPARPRLEMDDVGLDIGVKVPITKFKSLVNKSVELITPNKSGTVVVFLSINCGACSNVIANLTNFIQQHSNLSVVVFMRGNDENEIFMKLGNLTPDIPVIKLTDELQERFIVTLYPFAYFLSSTGTVLAKGGIPAGKPHLELLTSLGLSNKKVNKKVAA